MKKQNKESENQKPTTQPAKPTKPKFYTVEELIEGLSSDTDYFDELVPALLPCEILDYDVD